MRIPVSLALMGFGCTAPPAPPDEPSGSASEPVDPSSPGAEPTAPSAEGMTAFPPEVFDDLDYGLYWFAADGSFARATGSPHPGLYDPERPTFVYVHGWQPGTTEGYFREMFDWDGAGATGGYLADEWVEAGWNVGAFYWNQFADEPEVLDAEAKIWSVDGPQGMRWRSADGAFHHSDAPSQPVSVLLADALVAAMAEPSDAGLQLAGSSLGGGLVIAATGRLRDEAAAGTIDPRLVPTRIALLDPFFGNGERSFLGDRWTGEVAREEAAAALDMGVLLEHYRSSPATGGFLVGDANEGLTDLAAYVELRPWYFAAWDVQGKHLAAVWHYMWSMAYPPPPVSGSVAVGLSAATPDERVLELQLGSDKLLHAEGAYTETPGDDVQVLRAR